MNIVERRRPARRPVRDDASTVATSTCASSTTSTIWGEKTVLRLLDRTRSLYRLGELGMPPDADALYSAIVASPFGMVIVRRPDRQRQDHDAVRDVVGDQPARHQRHDDRGPGRVHLPARQPDPDQRAGRHDVRHRAQVDPAPGPRRDPRRRGPRRRDRAHRGAVGAHRPPRVLVGARDRRRRRRSTGCSTWASSRSSSPPRSSAWSRSGSCAASARRARPPYEPSLPSRRCTRSSAARPKDVWLRGHGLPVLLGHRLLRPRRRVRGARRSPTRSASASSTAQPPRVARELAIEQGLRTLQTEAVRLVETDVTTMEEVVKHVLVNEGLDMTRTLTLVRSRPPRCRAAVAAAPYRRPTDSRGTSGSSASAARSSPKRS